MWVSSVENAMDKTYLEWPFRLISYAPVEASHTRTDWSFEPETMRVPSLENANPIFVAERDVRGGRPRHNASTRRESVLRRTLPDRA